jgi:hypothetical protein
MRRDIDTPQLRLVSRLISRRKRIEVFSDQQIFVPRNEKPRNES